LTGAAALLATILLASVPVKGKGKPAAGKGKAAPASSDSSSSESRGVPHPESVGDYFDAVDYAMDADEYAAAERIAREGSGHFPQAVGFHLLIGDALAARGKMWDAFFEYQWEALRVGPERPSGAEAQAKAGQILENGRGTDVDELRVIVQAVEQTDADPAASAATLARFAERRPCFVIDVLLAEAEAKAGRNADAINDYRELIRRDEFFVPAYVELGELLEKAGKAQEGKALVAKARGIDPDHWRLKGASDAP